MSGKIINERINKMKKQKVETCRFRESMDEGNRLAFENLDFKGALKQFKIAKMYCDFLGDLQELVLAIVTLEFSDRWSQSVISEIERKSQNSIDQSILAVIFHRTDMKKALFHLHNASKTAKTRNEFGRLKETAETLGVEIKEK